MKGTTRVGIGFDVHRLVRGTKLYLGGLEISSDMGLEGHSDGDVLLHAVTDAILGACALGDIGDRFPPSDPQWKGASSVIFLQEALARADDLSFRILNVDTVIVAERPHLGAWKEGIRATLAGMLGLPVTRVNVKAKTMEGLGPVGEGRAIEAHAVVLVRRTAEPAAAPARKRTKSAKASGRKGSASAGPRTTGTRTAARRR